MAEYIEKSAAVVIADYSADEHPYSKDPEHPETYSDYNQGWNDACDYIRGKLEDMPDADVAQVRHGKWIETQVETGDPFGGGNYYTIDVYACSECGEMFDISEARNYCPNCGARMDGDTNA